MKQAQIQMKAYILTNTNNTEGVCSTKQLKSDQFINLLATCNISTSLLSALPQVKDLSEQRLIFIDVGSLSEAKSIPDVILQLAIKNKVALFNCHNNSLDETKLLLAGIHGVFYITDRADIILKGIENLLADERWFKRETMNIAISQLLSNSTSVKQNTNLLSNDKFVFPSLTKREKTIINLVSSGAQNKEIATQLHISPNTVKTHIYSIFRKTSSRNRIELLSWSKQFQ